MKKRILSFILAAAMALSLTACGGSSSTSTSSTANTDKTDSSAASESTEAVHLTLAHADTETGSLFGECTIAFKEMVEEKSNGSIIIDIYRFLCIQWLFSIRRNSYSYGSCIYWK